MQAAERQINGSGRSMAGVKKFWVLGSGIGVRGGLDKLRLAGKATV
jgi:hypothetical protein